MTTIGIDNAPRLSEEFWICNCGTLTNDEKHFSCYGHDAIRNIFLRNPITDGAMASAREVAYREAFEHREMQWELSRIKQRSKFELVPDYVIDEAQAGNTIVALVLGAFIAVGLVSIWWMVK